MEKNLVLYGILCYTKINVPRAAGRGQERMSGYVSRSGKSRYGTDFGYLCPCAGIHGEKRQPYPVGGNYPSPELLEEDIDTNRLFVYMVNGQMQAVFAFILGEDPTYKVIEDGQWLNDTLPYGTLHRLASAGESKGIGKAVVEWCLEHCESLRADTHADNKVMQHLLESEGFTRCGIIHVEDGTPRIAYQRLSLTQSQLG